MIKRTVVKHLEKDRILAQNRGPHTLVVRNYSSWNTTE